MPVYSSVFLWDIFLFWCTFMVFITFGYLELLHLETILQLRTFRSGQMCVFASGTGQVVLLVCAGFTRNSLLYSFFHPFFTVKINMFAKPGKYIDSCIWWCYSCYSYMSYLTRMWFKGSQREAKGQLMGWSELESTGRALAC